MPSIVRNPSGLGLLRQSIKAGEYRDGHVRISAYVKTAQLNGTAYFLLTIYGGQDQAIYLNSRAITTSTDWQWLQFILNVPVNSERIEYGLALSGEGQAWIDDVRIEFVGPAIAASSFEMSPLQYMSFGASQSENLDFESGTDLQGWYHGSNTGYEVGIDHGVVHMGRASAHIKSEATVTDQVGLLAQTIRADDYLGKRVRLSAYIKADQVEGWAGLWMNIDSSYRPLGYDNMQNRPIFGTSDWQKAEIVLDVPPNSASMTFGVLLSGPGELWLDDVQLDVVGADVPTTDSSRAAQQQPLNLGFEN